MVSQKSKKEKDKALAKILDSSNIQSRIKALKTCLENLKSDEMKCYLCETGFAYYYVWYDFYTLHVDPALRAALGKALSKDLRDDLDTLLFVIERLIHLMPEKLASGWHCNSLSAFLRRLLTTQCAPRYRHAGVKIFLAWFQIVRHRAPAEMVFLFSTLVPGLDQTRLPNDLPPNSISNVVLSANNTSQTVSITSMNSCCRGTLEPLVPASASELAASTLDTEALRVMENILNHLIANVSYTCWTDSRAKTEAFEFMLNQFRQKYLFKIFQEYNHKMDLYADNKVCETVNYIKEERHLIVKMKVLLVRWIMKLIPTQKRRRETIAYIKSDAESASHPKGMTSSVTSVRNLISSNQGAQAAADHGVTSQQAHHGVEAYQIAYQVLTSSRDNINMCLEILRQGLLLPLTYSDMTLAVINLFNSWLNLKESERPIFVQNRHLEDFDACESQNTLELQMVSSADNMSLRQKMCAFAQQNFSESLDESRLRSMGLSVMRSPVSKTSRCVSEVAETSALSQDHLRVGLQNYLQYFFRSLSAIFYIEPNYDVESDVRKLNEIRYRVVTVFRHVAVTSGRRDFPQIQTASTWHHLINILLHASTFIFSENRHKAKCNQHFISNLINSLLVSCIMSNLFVRMGTSVWDDVTQLLSSVVECCPVVVEQWAKTTNFLTVKILSPNVYNIDYSALEQMDKAGGSLNAGGGDSKRFSKAGSSKAKPASIVTDRQPQFRAPSSNKATNHHQNVTRLDSQGGSYPKDPSTVPPVAAVQQNKTLDAASAPLFAESLTTQALNQMLHGSQTALASKCVRPSSLLLAEKRDQMHKSKMRKFGNNMAASSLYSSKSENCLLYASLTDDSFVQSSNKHEGDSDSCDVTETNVGNFQRRRGTEGCYDSEDNEASVIRGGTSSGLDQSYNTESLASELVVSVSDGGSVKFDPEGSVASHDTQMSWLHTVASASAATTGSLSPPVRDIAPGNKQARTLSPEQTKVALGAESDRLLIEGKTRPNSDVTVSKQHRPIDDLGDTKSRNSWAGDQRKSESSSVRFVEDVLKNGQSPERMAPGSGATPLTPSRDDSDDLDAPVFQPDHSPNIEENQLQTSSEDASEMRSYSYANEAEEVSNTLSLEESSPRNSSSITSWALTSENRSIITGGEIVGWTRESAFVLWRRILGVIGNVNDIKDPSAYTNVMKHLVQLHDVLQRIAENQSFVDEDGFFQLPSYVPPVAILLPWAIAGCRRIEDVDAPQSGPPPLICEGILLTHKLAAQIVLEYPAINKGTVTSFFQIVYENMKLNRMELKQIFVEHMYKLYSTNLSGSMVLLKVMTDCACDVIHCSSVSPPSSEMPSKECVEKAVVLLGSLVCFPEHYKRHWKCLQLEGAPRGQTQACMYPMASLAHSIFSGVSLLLAPDNVSSNIAASCYCLSTLCVMCVSELRSDAAPAAAHKWFSFNKCISLLASPLKFNDVSPNSGSASHLTSHEVSLAQLSAHYLHCVFDLLLVNGGGGDNGSHHNSEVLKNIIHSILWACDAVVRSFIPDKNMLSLLVALMLTLQDCVCQMPLDLLAEKVAMNKRDNDGDQSSQISLSECVHQCLKNVQDQCRSWMGSGQFSSQETESVQESSEHSVDYEVNLNVVSSPAKDKQLTSSSSSSSNLSSATTGARPPAENGSSKFAPGSHPPAHTTVPPNQRECSREIMHVANKLCNAADLVSNVILCLMGRYPDWEGGVTKLDSAVTEADNNPAASTTTAAELTPALINNEYSQVFVHNENTIISVLELPQSEDAAGSASKKKVRFILRDLSGKYCYDFIPVVSEENNNENSSTLEKDDTTGSGMNDATIPFEPNTGSHCVHSHISASAPEGSEINGDYNQIKDRAGNGDQVKSASISETGVEVQMSGHDLRGELESIVKMDDDQNGGDGGGSFSSSSSAGGTAGTEHADLGSSTPSYDILEYLDSSPPEKPDKIPNALNDILEYLSTSEDLLDYPGQRLDSAPRPTGYIETYQENIKAIEKEMLHICEKEKESGARLKLNQISAAQFPQHDHKDEERPFAAAARLLMQLNCFSWNNRKTLFLLNKNASLIKELKHLDTQSLRETHKFAVIYVANGQETKASILSNQGGSREYEAFLGGLGWEVDVETHKGYLGLLPSNGSVCKSTPYFASPTCEVLYHVATKMTAPAARGTGTGGGGTLNQQQKWRHIGNDHVHIVWNEHCRPYRRSVMPTQFADVIIVLSPMPNKLIQVNISCKPPLEPHLIGPLFDGAIVDFAILPLLVRVTAIRANTLLKHNKQGCPIFFESRQKAMESIVKRFKLMQIYEDFVIHSVNPSPPVPPATAGQLRCQLARSNAASVRVSSAHSQAEAASLEAANAAPVATSRAAQRLEALFHGGSFFDYKAIMRQQQQQPPLSSNFSTVHLPASRASSGNRASASGFLPSFSKTHSGALSRPQPPGATGLRRTSHDDSPPPVPPLVPRVFRVPWRSRSLSISSNEDSCSD